MIDQIFGELIKERRLSIGMSLGNAAKIFGVTKERMRQIESGGGLSMRFATKILNEYSLTMTLGDSP